MQPGGDWTGARIQHWSGGGEERCCPIIPQHTHRTNLHQVRIYYLEIFL